MRLGDVDSPLGLASEPQQRWQEAAGACGELSGSDLQTVRSGWLREARAARAHYALALRPSRPLWSPGRPPRQWRGGAIRRS